MRVLAGPAIQGLEGPKNAPASAIECRAFPEFLVGRKLTANQNEFLNMVIDHLTARGPGPA
jgi:hypothetical protein